MQLYLDTANAEKISHAIETGCIRGVTTNPSIISRENKPFMECVQEIIEIDKKLTILLEVVSSETKKMVEEAKKLAKIGDQIVIKLPATEAGLAAVFELSKIGIPTTVTLVFSINQAIASACSGATYVAPFIGRLEDISSDGIQLVNDIREVFSRHSVKTKIIAASIRSPKKVSELFLAGADIVTMPYNVFLQMLKHPLTDKGLEKFEQDWAKVPS